MVLAGLASVLIPAVSDMVARTNAGTASANIAEVSNSIQRYETLYLSYPDNLDGLMTDLIGTDLDTLTPGLTAVTADVTLTAGTLAPLNAAGISTVGIHSAGDTTFDLPTLTTLTNTTVIKGLSAAAQVSMGLETSGTLGKYVCFGIGTLSEMTGSTTIDAPVYFPENDSLNPEDVYGRYIAVFQITDGTDPLERARLKTVITATGTTLGTNIANYFEAASDN
jgi:hypothetical protein